MGTRIISNRVALNRMLKALFYFLFLFLLFNIFHHIALILLLAEWI
jgi:hypothetical protein